MFRKKIDLKLSKEEIGLILNSIYTQIDLISKNKEEKKQLKKLRSLVIKLSGFI